MLITAIILENLWLFFCRQRDKTWKEKTRSDIHVPYHSDYRMLIQDKNKSVL